jgi:hypothetical protein
MNAKLGVVTMRLNILSPKLLKWFSTKFGIGVNEESCLIDLILIHIGSMQQVCCMKFKLNLLVFSKMNRRSTICT